MTNNQTNVTLRCKHSPYTRRHVIEPENKRRNCLKKRIAHTFIVFLC